MISPDINITDLESVPRNDMLLVLIREVNFSSGSARSVWGRDLNMAGSIDLFSDDAEPP